MGARETTSSHAPLRSKPVREWACHFRMPKRSYLRNYSRLGMVESVMGVQVEFFPTCLPVQKQHGLRKEARIPPDNCEYARGENALL
jgi:hypothetical protein